MAKAVKSIRGSLAAGIGRELEWPIDGLSLGQCTCQNPIARTEVVFHLAYQRAEVAMKAGRLDEVVSLLAAPQLRGHRNGQKLLDRLVDALVTRGHEHLSADRDEDARNDVFHAKQLAGHRADVAELARQVDVKLADHRDRQRQHDKQLKVAGKQIQAGALTIGAKLVEAMGDPRSTGSLAEDVELQRATLSDAIARMRTALDQGDHEAAIAIYAELTEQHQMRPEVSGVAAEAAEQLCRRANDALREGRLDRLAAMETSCAALRHRFCEVREMAELLERCRRIRNSLTSADYSAAEQELSLLGHVAEDDGWIETTGNAIREAIGQLALIQSGPLGLLAATETNSPALPAALGPVMSSDFADAPQQSLLQVDGLGSLLLLRQTSVKIGGAGRSSSCDLPLLTDSVVAPLMVRRDGDDYLAHSDAPFKVNGRTIKHKLLTSGDTIEIGRRGRLRFRKPVAASGSAVLELTAAGLARGDIRHVVLMADSLLFGPRGTHFPVESIDTAIVLSLIEGQFALRRLAPSPQSEHLPTTTSQRSRMHLRFGESVVIDGTRFSLCPYSNAAGC